MSSLASWSYRAAATIWPMTGRDPYGQPTYGTPYVIACSWEEGGDTKTDANGNEFVPRSTYYFEAPRNDASIPELGWFIAVGDMTSNATPTNDSQPIRRVGGWGAEMFGASEIPDWEINT